jgi:hypothetical protein
MRRFLSLALGWALLWTAACGSRAKVAGFDAALEWSNLEKQAADLKVMRGQITDLKNQVAKWEAEKRAPGTYKPEELPSKSIEVLKSQLDAIENNKYKNAGTAFWDNLTLFLNRTMNNSKLKALPETAKAVRLYSDETIVLAEESIQNSGNYDHALTLLQQALQLDKDSKALQDRIARAKDYRFLTKKRFDAVNKGMGLDEVKALCGVPNPSYIKEKTEKGKILAGWFYLREDQGTAGFFFQDGKIYEKLWDAQKK